MVNLGYYEGIRPAAALAVVVATVALYLAFGFFLHVARPRLLASPSSLDLAVVAIMGPLVGRAILGRVPTLAAGVIALATLAVVRLVAHLLSSHDPATARHPPVAALVVDGEVDHEQLGRHGLTVPALWAALREAGVGSPDQVALAVLERNGRVSVLRSGAALHPDALTGVAGAEAILGRLGA